VAELDTKAHAAFTAWCFERYAKRSARKLSLDVRTMVVNDGVPPESQQKHKRLRDYAWAWDVWKDWAAENGGAVLPVPRPTLPTKARGSARRAATPKRLREALSLPEDVYLALLHELSGSSDSRACALNVIARTGLRVSDLMRIELAAIRRAFKRPDGLVRITVKGGKEVMISVHSAAAAWRAIGGDAAGKLVTVADWVMGTPSSDTEAGGAAYERVEQYLSKLGKRIAPTERWHIHRLRRTIAMRLLEAGHPIEVVRDALGHSDTRTTRGYTDENRAAAAAKALAGLTNDDEDDE